MVSADEERTVDAAIARLHAAMADVANGDVRAIKALYSRSEDATSFYGWGGWEKGWAGVSARWDWAGQQFRGGTVSYKPISKVVAGDLFYVTEIETYAQQSMAGMEGKTGWTNRVTHIFRKEEGAWRLIHRHGNRLEEQFKPGTRLKPTE
ncbi:MAG: nuclear transport factor 2 family protein [Hyphomicrobiaceae bacterium]